MCSGLRQGAVDTLIIGDIGEETVVADDELTTLAPTAEMLSEQGAAVRPHAALTRWAVRLPELTDTDAGRAWRTAPVQNVAVDLRAFVSVDVGVVVEYSCAVS